jgi:hypothetical protein
MKRDFALVKPNTETGEHEVMTITIFDNPTEADMAARAIYGATAYAKESSMWDVKLPTIVKDGTFYNLKMTELRGENGDAQNTRVGETPAECIPSEAEQIAELTRKNAELKEVIDTLVLDSLGGM